jgi:hypothetical protein
MGRSAVPLVVVLMAIGLLMAGRAPRAEAHTIYDIEVIPQVSGKCLDMQNLGQGALSYQWSCVGVAWQKWQIIPVSGSSYQHYIVNSYTHLCLDVPNANPYQGLQLWMWPYSHRNVDGLWAVRLLQGLGAEGHLHLGAKLALRCRTELWGLQNAMHIGNGG